jgi:NitT/TauT family transport system ATP-binding protein
MGYVDLTFEMNRGDMQAIRVEKLSKTFESEAGDVTALKEIDLDIETGSWVSIVGPSGCGKTTLLRIVADLEEATTGRVLVNGKDASAARISREIGLVFQRPALLEWRSVEDNVSLPAEIMGDADILSRVGGLVEMVGLSGFEKSFPRELSGGMQSRVAIARALSFRPGILLLDEPLGALDEITRERMQLELLRIWGEVGTTVLLITHSIAEAILLSDRVLVMSSRPGRIVEDLAIDFPRPRRAELRADPAFVGLQERLRKSLEG